MENELEGRIRFTCLLVRETFAAWVNEVNVSARSAAEASAQAKPDDIGIPPSLIIDSTCFARQAAANLKGEFRPSILAEACIFIVSKTNNYLLRLRTICDSGRLVEARRSGRINGTLEERMSQVLAMEMRVLTMCGFIVNRYDEQRAHRFLFVLSEIVVPQESRSTVLHSAWAYLNDACMLDLDNERPFDIACAGLALAAQDASVSLPSHPIPWFEAVGAKTEAMERIAFKIYELINEWTFPQWLE